MESGKGKMMETPTPTIHILDKSVAQRIAAGEVVERPASVVKELIENAIDAGSTAIQVEVRDGGLSLIRVSDNGCGISREDAPLALERFATSKIRVLEDLEAIRTLGFRGEALSSVAAVAQLELLARPRDELEGTRLRAMGGQTAIEPSASPVGTSVTVRNLFYNAPARRKFLKSPRRESELIYQTVVRYSLAYPAIAFRLVADGRERYVAPPVTLLERVGTALGREVAAEMAEICWEASDLGVQGFISRPTIGRARRDAQFFFVNGRPIRAGLLAVMLERPYAGRLPLGRHPLAVICIEIAPQLVDVNVHPRKAEVRFAQERSIYGAVAQAVEAALAIYPRQREAPIIAWPFEGVEPLLIRERGPSYGLGGGLRAVGQIHNTYILAQSPEGLAIVDQHAAHEQVLFEGILRGGEIHLLRPPARLQVTSQEAELLEGHIGLLAGLGLEIEAFGGHTFLIRSLPEVLAGGYAGELVTVLLQELARYRQAGEEELRERLAMKAACAAAIKAGDPLTPEGMQELLDQLGAVWSPATCPHGRPAFITLTLEELERRFLRR